MAKKKKKQQRDLMERLTRALPKEQKFVLASELVAQRSAEVEAGAVATTTESDARARFLRVLPLVLGALGVAAALAALARRRKR